MGLTIGAGGVLYGTTADGGWSGYGMVFKLTLPAAPGGTWKETELFTFNYGDGAGPNAGVIAGANGVLYGSTFTGGNGVCAGDGGCGTVF
jgi:hypothetical protein